LKLIKLDKEQYIYDKHLVSIFYNTKDLHTVVVVAGFGGLKCADSHEDVVKRAIEGGVKLVKVGNRQYINKEYLIAVGKSQIGKGKLIVRGVGALEAGYSLDDVLKVLREE